MLENEINVIVDIVGCRLFVLLIRKEANHVYLIRAQDDPKGMRAFRGDKITYRIK